LEGFQRQKGTLQALRQFRRGEEGWLRMSANCQFRASQNRLIEDESNFLRLLAYEHPWLKQVLVEQHALSSSAAEELIIDLLRFLHVKSTFSSIECCPSRQIDLCWKEFICFTQDYHDFCQRFFGDFIHRKPVDLVDEASFDCIARTRELATSLFGKLSENWNCSSTRNPEV
jgi:hypothetical protein